jgi:hypothetical protein
MGITLVKNRNVPNACSSIKAVRGGVALFMARGCVKGNAERQLLVLRNNVDVEARDIAEIIGFGLDNMHIPVRFPRR